MKPSANEAQKIRLQVFLSHSGVCSRRKAMDIIFEGRVSVNGEAVSEPSFAVDPLHDQVRLDGKPVQSTALLYVMLNKPRGYVTTRSDFHNEKTVMDLLPKELQHLYPVGRLDKETEGFLLLTNDGDIALRLTHPRFNINKTYLVGITGRLEKDAKAHLENGVMIEEKMTAPCSITQIKEKNAQTEFLITLHEGRKRQIRLMLLAVGHKIDSLKRIQQGPLGLGDLPVGKWRLLSKEEITALKAM